MKTGAVTALCLLAVIIAGGILLSGAASAATDRCTAAANEIAMLAQMGDWTRAEDTRSAYAAQWKEARAHLDLLLPKEALDSVTEAYEELGWAISFRNAERCAEICGDLIRSAEEVREGESVTVENLM